MSPRCLTAGREGQRSTDGRERLALEPVCGRRRPEPAVYRLSFILDQLFPKTSHHYLTNFWIQRLGKMRRMSTMSSLYWFSRTICGVTITTEFTNNDTFSFSVSSNVNELKFNAKKIHILFFSNKYTVKICIDFQRVVFRQFFDYFDHAYFNQLPNRLQKFKIYGLKKLKKKRFKIAIIIILNDVLFWLYC